ASSAGLLRFDGRAFDRVEVSPGGRRTVTALLAGEGQALWVGSEGGPPLVRFDGSAHRTWGEAEGLPLARGRAIANDGSGGVWVGGDGGFANIDGEGRVTHLARLPNDTVVRALGRGPDGSLWVGTNEGLARWRGDRYQWLWGAGPVTALLALAPA